MAKIVSTGTSSGAPTTTRRTGGRGIVSSANVGDNTPTPAPVVVSEPSLLNARPAGGLSNEEVIAELRALRTLVSSSQGSLPTSTVANLPSASPSGQHRIVTDEIAGMVAVYSDGSLWRRILDNRAVLALPKTILINGQSNAVDTPSGDLGKTSMTRFLGSDLLVFNHETQQFEQAQDCGASHRYTVDISGVATPGQSGAGRIGTTLMRRLADRSGSTIRAYCAAYTSQGVSYFLPGSATTAYFGGDNSQHGSLNNYNLLKAHVAAGGAIPELYVWVQGEANAGWTQLEYYTELKTVFDASRIDYPGIKWLIVGNIGNEADRTAVPGGNGAPATGVRLAEQQLADENPGVVFLVDNTDFIGSTTYFDGVHYNEVGAHEVGERAFATLEGIDERPRVELVPSILESFDWDDFYSHGHTVNGSGRVTQWQTDIAPNTNVMVPHLAQPSSTPPAHVAYDPEFNNHSVMEFSSEDDAEENTLKITGLTAFDDLTVGVVSKTLLTGGSVQYLFSANRADSSHRFAFSNKGQSNKYQWFTQHAPNGSDFSGGPGFTADDVRPYSIFFVYDSTAATMTLYIDGVLFGTAATGTETAMTEIWLASLIQSSVANVRVACFGYGLDKVGTAAEALAFHRAAKERYKLKG